MMYTPHTTWMLTLAVLIGWIGIAPVDVTAQDAETLRRVEASVDAGLAYLAGQQQPDGHFPSGYGDNHAINAVCLLAFLGRGHVPGRGPYRAVVDRALQHLLDGQAPTGLFASKNPSYGVMYEHALATLAVIEASGFTTDVNVRIAAQRAVDLIVTSQNGEGGWRYQPEPKDADSSVTAMQVVTLRAAENAKLTVPQQTLDDAMAYLEKCADPKRGGFGYMPNQGPETARSAAGLLCYFLTGRHDDPHVEKTLAYLRPPERFYFKTAHLAYASYYSMQAHFQAGGEHWAHWGPRTVGLVHRFQQADGSFKDFGHQRPNGNTHCYGTAMALLTLEVYMHYLPAYQR